MATEAGAALYAAEPAAASCCSAFYEQDWVRLLAEDSFHPGGADLSARTVGAMALPPAARLLDLGCGTGSTALRLAREGDSTIDGVDLSAANIARAQAAADSSRAVRFVSADAHALPYTDGSFDGVLAECVFSLLADKAGALNELLRVLGPGGALGLTDMAVGGPLPEDIARVIAPWTCLADAMDEDAYAATFRAAGFALDAVADESAGLTALIRRLKLRLIALGTGGLLAGCVALPVDVATVRHWLERFAAEVAGGTIRYLRFQLRAPD